jgi:hypothetical protein
MRRRAHLRLQLFEVGLALDLGSHAVSLDALADILLVCVFQIKHESF